MAENFEFLKKVDKDLFEIISDAENLYRNEFFEQCMTQTRRFGEVVCKNVLGSRRTTEITFDSMLATLKDCSLGGNLQEKEFVNDLYFLKKHGNEAAHSFKVKQDGMEALECLKTAFEVAISYCVYSCKTSRSVLDLQYDTELLLTGKKSKKSLTQRYSEEKAKNENKSKNKKAKKIVQYCSVKSEKREKKHLFWIFVGISALVSAIMLIFLLVI